MKATCLLFALFCSISAHCQSQKIVFPHTAADLKQLCKSYELVALEIELKKTVGWDEVNQASSCLNFIMGVLSTVGSMDVGFFPDLKYEITDVSKPIAYKEFVSSFMKHIAAHPEHEKDPAAAVVALSLMEAKILAPAHWQKSQK